jgi:Leucine-rich repeat (LRR) protein
MKKNFNQKEIPVEIFEGKKPAKPLPQQNPTSSQPVSSKITNSNFIKNNQKTNVQNANSKTMIHKIKQAKTTGVINISDMNLDKLPQEIFDENLSFEDVNWWQIVDITKIEASTNKITDVTENFSSLPGLNYLRFSNNLFKMIPNSIYNLHLLKYLDFSHNKLTHLSENIRSLSSLVELNLSNNDIALLPEEIGGLKNLEVIYFSNNKLTCFPKSFGNLAKLKKIDFSCNNIEYIQANLGQLNLLEELALFKNKIKEIEYGALEPLINLKLIDLHINNLKGFSNVPASSKLHSINLGYNKIEMLENLRNCPNLNDLDLNNNKISNFPMDILNLQNLKTLNITNNSINDLPAELCFLKELVRLYIEGNPLKKLNSKLRGASAEVIKNYLRTKLTDQELIENEPIQNPVNATLQNITNLLQFYMNKSLKINNAKLESIPLEINRLNRDIISLDFSNNNIKDLSALENLKEDIAELNLSSNKIMAKNLPKNILYMESLRTLDLKGNLLNSFFEEHYNSLIYGKDKNYGVFTNLEYLDLSMNKLSSVPSILTFSNRLKILLLSNNEIKHIDILVKNNSFSNLETLDLGTNKISLIPDGISNAIPHIKTFVLDNNELKTIPTEIGFLHLTKLSISGNPLKQIRFNVISGGSACILDYLKKMHKGGYIQNNMMEEEVDKGNLNISNKTKTLINNNIIVNDTLMKENNKSTSNSNYIQQNKPSLIYNENVEYDLENLNRKILEVEYEMQNVGNNMNKKQEVRRKLNELIRLRANLLK